jgi:tetratricopeptide (TPR) repeat protein
MNRSSVHLPILGFCTVAAYASGFGGVFVFDDIPWIVENESIRHLWPPWKAAGGSPRVLLFFSLAVNYAVSGLHIWSYHAVNLIVHLLAAGTLYGLLRRILSDTRGDEAGSRMALVAATLWAVHPLNTQAVTYIIQRGESLMGLCFLAALYCLHRSDRGSSRHWQVGAAAAFFAGLATKEVMVVALPVMLAYDRLLLAGSFRQALFRRRWLYAVLGAPFVFAGLWSVVVDAGSVGALMQGDSVDATALEYARSQPGVLLQYLRLSVWPHPQYLDWGWTVATWQEAALPLLVVAALLTATAWGTWRGHRLAFAGIWFFVILAPTSTVVPLRDLLVEHRMYLALAAVITLAVTGVHRLLRRVARFEGRRLAAGGLAVLAIAGLGARTWDRNTDYHSQLEVWGPAVTERPDNDKRIYNLGLEFLLAERGLLEPATFSLSVHVDGASTAAREGVAALQRVDAAAAIEHLGPAVEAARQGDPARLADLIGGLGMARFLDGDVAGAVDELRRAVEGQPDVAAHRVNLSCALEAAGRRAEALDEARRAVALAGDLPEARLALGGLLARSGDTAREHLTESLRLRPSQAAAHNNLGAVLAATGKRAQALDHYLRAAGASPPSRAGQVNAGLLYLDLKQYWSAARNLQLAVDDSHHLGLSLKGLSLAMYSMGRMDRALEYGRRAVALAPDDAEGHNNLGNCLAASGALERAIDHYRQAVRLDPELSGAHHNLGRILYTRGRRDEAIVHLQRALALRPGSAVIAANLRAAVGR